MRVILQTSLIKTLTDLQTRPLSRRRISKLNELLINRKEKNLACTLHPNFPHGQLLRCLERFMTINFHLIFNFVNKYSLKDIKKREQSYLSEKSKTRMFCSWPSSKLQQQNALTPTYTCSHAQDLYNHLKHLYNHLFYKIN